MNVIAFFLYFFSTNSHVATIHWSCQHRIGFNIKEILLKISSVALIRIIQKPKTHHILENSVDFWTGSWFFKWVKQGLVILCSIACWNKTISIWIASKHTTNNNYLCTCAPRQSNFFLPSAFYLFKIYLLNF